MIELTRILTPVDFSEHSRHALAYAAALARWYGARVTALHVFINRPAVNVIPSLYPAPVMPIRFETIRNDAHAHLQQFVEAVELGGVPVDVVVEEAPDAYPEILAQAAALKASLLVMGTHGRSGLDRLLLGSTTEKVLRKATTCPVMTVPPAAPATVSDPIQFRRIVCPVDFSEGSLAALPYAMSLAEEADAQLTLLHAIELLDLHDMPMPPAFDPETIRVAVEADRLRRLQALVPQSVSDYCSVRTTVVEGRGSHAILRFASEHHADLIVMGVQGRGAIERMVFGSNTHHVVRGATCPVLTVRVRGAGD